MLSQQSHRSGWSALPLPSWHPSWDQGREGACVGFGSSMANSIGHNLVNTAEGDHRYDPFWLWTQAKKIDGLVHTDPHDGTTVHAAMRVLKNLGHVRVGPTGRDNPLSLHEGAKAYRWANTVDDVRAAIGQGLPVSAGVSWYENFDQPHFVQGEYWIGRDSLGLVRGGHCVCMYAASDKREAVGVKNSWGTQYPLVWLPYSTLDRLIKEQGELALITDR